VVYQFKVKIVYTNESKGHHLVYSTTELVNQESLIFNMAVNAILSFMEMDYNPFKMGLEFTNDGVRGLGMSDLSHPVEFFINFTDLIRYEVTPNRYEFKGPGKLKVHLLRDDLILNVQVFLNHV